MLQPVQRLPRIVRVLEHGPQRPYLAQCGRGETRFGKFLDQFFERLDREPLVGCDLFGRLREHRIAHGLVVHAPFEDGSVTFRVCRRPLVRIVLVAQELHQLDVALQRRGDVLLSQLLIGRCNPEFCADDLRPGPVLGFQCLDVFLQGLDLRHGLAQLGLGEGHATQSLFVQGGRVVFVRDPLVVLERTLVVLVREPLLSEAVQQTRGPRMFLKEPEEEIVGRVFLVQLLPFVKQARDPQDLVSRARHVLGMCAESFCHVTKNHIRVQHVIDFDVASRELAQRGNG